MGRQINKLMGICACAYLMDSITISAFPDLVCYPRNIKVQSCFVLFDKTGSLVYALHIYASHPFLNKDIEEDFD
jgi:hypothetical protein